MQRTLQDHHHQGRHRVRAQKNQDHHLITPRDWRPNWEKTYSAVIPPIKDRRKRCTWKLFWTFCQSTIWYVHYCKPNKIKIRMKEKGIQIKVRKKAKIRKRYNEVPHLTQDTTWESNKNTKKILPTRAKRSAFSQQVTTRHQWTCAKALETQDTKITNDPQKRYRLGTVSKIFYWRALTSFTAPTSPLVQMWIKTHRCLVSKEDT